MTPTYTPAIGDTVRAEKFESNLEYCRMFDDKINRIGDKAFYLEKVAVLKFADGQIYLWPISAITPVTKGIDLDKLERQLDDALAKETPESFEAFLKENNYTDPAPTNPLSEKSEADLWAMLQFCAENYMFGNIKRAIQQELTHRLNKINL